MTPTKEQVRAVFDVMVAITEVIRVKGEVPSGELYAQMMHQMNLATYNAIISKIKASGLVIEKNHLLTWVGPSFPKN